MNHVNLDGINGGFFPVFDHKLENPLLYTPSIHFPKSSEWCLSTKKLVD
jgi:hypothetical protein